MELFKLFGTIALNNSDANKGIDDTTSKAEAAKAKLGAAFEKIGSAAVAVGKTVAVGVGAAATAISALTKEAVQSYADYEQLVGGVDTLFKNFSTMVQRNAEDAYKTAGLSANEYMETVTSFSASLIQSLGGNTYAAAKYADMAITDMADNANKMGTAMSSIQSAYQGFAKQNYTMLDNLKLGYGGTQQEMFRLLSDAKEIDETFDAVFSIDSKGHLEAGYADIVKAINIVQKNMGITGTTQKEAAATISGSLAMTKSAWKNLLVGFADDSQDIGPLVTNLVDSAKTALDNLMPRIQQSLNGIVEFVRQIVPVISAELPVLLQTLLPGLIEAATALMVGLISALPQILQILIEQVPFIITQIAQALVTTFPILLDTAKSLFQQIWDYISLGLLNTGVSFDDAFAKIKEVFVSAWGVMQDIWNSVGQPIFDMVQNVVGIVRDKFASMMPEIKEFVSNCFGDIKAFWENNLKPCLDAIGDFIENKLAPKFEEIFENRILPVVDMVFGSIKDLWNNTLKPIFVGITDFLTGVFTGDWQKAWDGIKGIVTGIVNGIINSVEFMVNMVINAVNGIIGGINDVVGKVGDKIGLDINIPELRSLSLPRLERGGVLERGQIGFLEGNGAEAVVPLHQNRKWISAVAEDMNMAVGSDNKELKELKEIFREFVSALPEMMSDAFASMKWETNNREFARLVKAVT